MTLTNITLDTPAAEISRMRTLLDGSEFREKMPLAAHLADALDEVLRLRARTGDTLGETFAFKRITLCGSARFDVAFREWFARLMIEQSAMVFTAPALGVLTQAQSERIKEIWLAQIDASDAIFVLDVGGYVGESVAEEVAFAKERGVAVRYLSDEAPGWTEADCRFASFETPGPSSASRPQQDEGDLDE